MSDPLTVLKKELPFYINDVKNKHSENSKSMAFSSFIQKVFGIQPSELDFEVSVDSKIMQLKGRIDAVFGNMLIEFKRDLSKGLDDAKEELKKYFQAYHEKFPGSKYIGIANDGILFKVYQPIKHNDVVTELEEIGSINLETSTPEDVFNWFDGYFFTSSKIIPTSEHLKQSFGINSPTYAVIRQELLELFDKVKDDRHIKIKYDNWSRYLEIVYGDAPNEINLFIAHTYVSTFAKLLVYLKLSGQSRFSSPSIPPILYGTVFSQYGIQNFVEEDFFTWIMYITIRQQASKIFEKLLRDMEVYDLDQINEDILKELYQDMVHPIVRKQLGEFYTPDWLADTMIEDVLHAEPTYSVLDPSCGSGTFLFKTILYKIKKLKEKKLKDEQILSHMLENVIGFDIHPLAALISKTNYLLALKDLLHSRKSSITIPVYLSDSLKLPTKKIEISDPITTFEFETQIEEKNFLFPMKIIDDMTKMDDIIEKMKEYGHQLEDKIEKIRESSYKIDINEVSTNLENNFQKAISNIKNENERNILMKNIKTLFDLIKNNADSIWTYVLRNMYKPVALSHRKVDLIIGNPPWLGLNNMKNEKYQDYVKERSKYYHLVDMKKTQNISNLNLASLFFCQCIDQYLKDGGKIAFVMPQSVLVSSQHENFLKFEYPEVELQMLYDLEGVSPLFRIPSCVIFARKGSKTKYPIDLHHVSGKLKGNNMQLTEAISLLDFKPLKFTPQKRSNVHSYYYDKFSQGAQIIPRSFWFVDIESSSFLGFNPTCPFVKSSENKDAKAPWNNVKIDGNVEKQFIFTTILSKDVIPFGYLKRRLVVLPVLIHDNKTKLITDSKQSEISQLSFSKYLEKAEKLWDENAPIKSKKNMSIYDRVDYQKDLTSQISVGGYKILYVKSATYMTSCVIDQNEDYNLAVDNNDFMVSGFFAEGTTYFYHTNSKEEAYYLLAILNSKTLDDLIKPLQSRGSFGERDIHKLPLSFQIPKYDSSNSSHKKLVSLGMECSEKIPKIVPNLNVKSVGSMRSMIRKILEDELAEIDVIVAELLQ